MWFTCGSGVVSGWFWGGSRLVRGLRARPGPGQWAAAVDTLGSKVVHAWFQDGSRMVLGWFASGSGMAH
eukprot:2460224-Pyramimonas_sp.AAC.1